MKFIFSTEEPVNSVLRIRVFWPNLDPGLCTSNEGRFLLAAHPTLRISLKALFLGFYDNVNKYGSTGGTSLWEIPSLSHWTQEFQLYNEFSLSFSCY